MLSFELLSLTGYRIRFVSKSLEARLEDLRYLVEGYLPGVSLEQPTGNKPDVVVYFNESESKSLEILEGEIVINDTWGGSISLDLWHFLYSVIRKDLLANNLFPVHAACTGKGKMVLLVGHTSMGKTTVMLKLVNDYNWRIFSGNKTVIKFGQGMVAVAGTKTVSIKEGDIDVYPDLESSAVNYANRSALFLGKDYYDPRSSVPIEAVCLVKVDSSVHRMEELSFPSTMHSLYPFFLDAVNADTVMCGGDVVYPGDPPAGSREVLAKNLKKFLPSMRIFSAVGSTEYLADQIQKLI